MKAFLWVAMLSALGIIGGGCANYRPAFCEDALYFQRVKTEEQGAIRVSVVGLSAAESKKTFGVDLARFKILPVWLKIENNDFRNSYFFLERGIDPNYYPSGEAAYIARIKPGFRFFDKPFLRPFSFLGLLAMPIDHFFVQSANSRMRETFSREAIKYGWILPKETKTGFVFVPFEMGTKQVTVDFYGEEIKAGRGILRHFDFFVNIPGIWVDYRDKEFERFYAPENMKDYTDKQEFKEALEKLPPCVMNLLGTKNGDPVNLIVIGSLEEVLEAFTTADWDETEVISFKSVMKMIRSFFSKGIYDYSPVSSLYLYGRSQDLALQKARDTINERMHLRLWYSPMRFNGKPVWIGQASRDIGVRFTSHTWNLMTHKIDPDIDESALYVLSDLIYRNRIEEYDVVSGGVPRTPENPGRNLTGDPYYTSGKRIVMLLPENQAPRLPTRFFLPPENSTPAENVA